MVICLTCFFLPTCYQNHFVAAFFYHSLINIPGIYHCMVPPSGNIPLPVAVLVRVARIRTRLETTPKQQNNLQKPDLCICSCTIEVNLSSSWIWSWFLLAIRAQFFKTGSALNLRRQIWVVILGFSKYFTWRTWIVFYKNCKSFL